MLFFDTGLAVSRFSAVSLPLFRYTVQVNLSVPLLIVSQKAGRQVSLGPCVESTVAV